MLPYALEDIDADTLEEICRQQFSESETVDFKRDLPARDEKGKVELAKDVAAMANTGGGDLIFGIKETDDGGRAGEIAEITEEPSDQAARRILQSLESKIEPRVQGLAIKTVHVRNGYVLVMRIPMSWSGPHCVRTDTQRRFNFRNGTLTSDMTYSQIKSAFNGVESLTEKARQFIRSRFDVAKKLDHTVQMESGPHAVFLFVPLAGINSMARISIPDGTALNAIFWPEGGANIRYSIDGPIVYSGLTPGTYNQSLIFRNGSIECVALVGNSPIEEQKGLYPDTFSQRLSGSIEAFERLAKTFKTSGPAIIGVALINVKGRRIPSNGFRRDYVLNLDHIEFPEIYIEDVSASWDLSASKKETIDMLYQAFGRPGAPRDGYL